MAASSRPQAHLDLAALAALGMLVLVSVWVRWPGFSQGGFASHDVAGILYNAMVLDRGGLPYVDTVELKAPGSFYLARALAGPEARDIARFQIWANLCAITSLVAVAAIAWRTWGRAAGVVAAIVYGLHDANLDSMDANYVTWANLPQIAAVGAGLEALRRTGRGALGWWLLAGAASGAAALLKRPDGIVSLVVVAMAAWPARGADGPGAGQGIRWRNALAVGAGVGLSQVPIVVHYAAHGSLGALADGYLLNRWGLRYVARGSSGSFVGEAALASAFFVGLPLVLCGFTIGRADRRRWAGPLRWLSLWAAATLVAAFVGARFYKGYFLATAAPLCLIAAAPWGLCGVRPLRPAWVRAAGLLAITPLVVRCVLSLQHVRDDRARPHDTGGRTIAAHVAENTTADDTIWVWGWHLWDVYPLANRMSGSRIYKSLGLLTPPNDDSWRRPASRLTFVDGEHAQTLIDDLRRNRPRYVVLGSTVPHREFEALHELLRAEYRRDRRVRLGRVQFWRLRDQTGG